MCSEVFVPHLLTVFRQYSDGRIVLDKSRWLQPIRETRIARSPKILFWSRATLLGREFTSLFTCELGWNHFIESSNSYQVLVLRYFKASNDTGRPPTVQENMHRLRPGGWHEILGFGICWAGNVHFCPPLSSLTQDRSVDPSKPSIFTPKSGCSSLIH